MIGQEPAGKTPSRFEGSASIAVVGIGCLFPDSADRDEYWNLIQKGRDAISPVPLTHWSPEAYFDPDPKRPDHTYAQSGGFLKPYAFDPLAFGLAPHALEATDTTQLLGMVVAHQALIDAGYGPERSFDRDRVSCILGVTGTLELVIPLGARLGHPIWKKALDDAGIPADVAAQVMAEIADAYVPWQENSFPGLLGNVVAGRIANRLDLGGTNSVVDAACASSLAALHMAMMELSAGKSDMVISGGMDTFNSIFMYMCFSKTPALSPSGQARPFDASGDGTILGEGLGAVILKRLDDAVRDGDRIYGVIRGMGTASDGKGQAIYAPSARGQVKTLDRAYREAGVSPRSVCLVEAHGTGTKVGDGVELQALKTVYRAADSEGAWCQLGSVKSQIGHTKAAAGAAGLIKALLALHHKILPPSIKVRTPHPELEASPFLLHDAARPWVSGGEPRRAAVSAFGFGGSNYHCVLEEYSPEKSELVWDPELYLALFSADDQMHLVAKLHQAQDDLMKGLHPRLLSRNWREEFKSSQRWRILCWARGSAELETRLVTMVEGLQKGRAELGPGILLQSDAGHVSVPELGLIFAGQGSQAPGMLRDLALRFPEFLESLEKSEALARERGEGSLVDLIYGPQAFDAETKAKQSRNLTETRYAQLSLAALGIATSKVLKRFGIEAAALGGHSFGELLALYAAGVLSEEATLLAAYERGRAMSEFGQSGGGLLAVMASQQDVESWLKESGLALSIANANAPEQTVLGGTRAELDKAQVSLKARRIGSRKLEVSGAFHTPLMADALPHFAARLGEIELNRASLPVFANSTAELYPDDQAEVRRVLSEQLVRPVRFMEMLRAMRDLGVDTFVEVGPQRKLAGIMKASLGEQSAVFSLDSEASDSLLGLASLLLELAAKGYPVLWSAWDPGPLADRAAASKPRFNVLLTGANYRTPRVKKDPLPAKASESKKVAPSTEILSPKPLEPATYQQGSLEPGKSTPALAKQMPQAITDKISVSLPKSTGKGQHQPIHEVAMSQPRSGDKPRMDQLLNDLQDIQRRTTEAHTLFLENQRQFQGMLQGIIFQESGWFEASAPQPFKASPHSEPAAVRQTAPRPAPSPAPSITPELSLGRAESSAPRQEPRVASSRPGATATSLPSPVREAPAKVSSELAKSEPAPKNQVKTQVLELLARLTGYPEHMLQESMRLESDLGIDSIKKVEIYSQLQQTFPKLTSDPNTMNEMQTIDDLITLCQSSQLPATSKLGSAGLEDEGLRIGAWSAGNVALAVEPVILPKAKTRELLAIIADKTGFPAEMLRAEMDLESDLGIDSIKKVEIFSSVQEHFSELGTLSNEQLNLVRTISDLEVLLQASSAPSLIDEPSAAEVKAELRKEDESRAEAAAELDNSLKSAAPFEKGESKRFGAQAVAAATRSSELVYRIVSEKTGYPLSVLTGDMELEADLGIDSIKKVEIYSALGEHITSVQGLSQEDSAQVRTLDDLVAQLGGEERTHDELLAEALLDPSLVGWDLSGKKKESDLEAPKNSGPISSSLGDGLAGSAELKRDADEEAVKAESEAETEIETELAASALSVRAMKLTLEPFHSRGPVRTFSSSHEVWIADDGSNLARNMMLKLQERGVQARLVSLAMHERWQIPENLGGLYLLAPLKFDNHPLRWLGQAFKLLRKVGPALIKNSGISFVVTVSRQGGRFGLDGLSQLNQCYAGGVAALAKTISQEWPGVHARALDLGKDFADGFEAALRVLETSTAEGPIELGVLREQTFRLTLEPEDLAHPQIQDLLNPGDLVLVTGGARGVTAAALMPLAERYQPHFVIWGRTPLLEEEAAHFEGVTSPAELKRLLLEQKPELSHPRELEQAYRGLVQRREIRANIQLLESKGAQVTYAVVDVSRENDLRQGFQQLKHLGVPVGIIHGAGVIHDRLLLEQKDEEVSAVLETKLRILSSFEEWLNQIQEMKKSEDESLPLIHPNPWIVLFSSSTARLGRKGQGAYALANEVLNKFAFLCQQLGGRGLALNWGPWDGGMVHDGLKKIFAAEGISPIPLEGGARLLLDLLTHTDVSGEWLIATSDSLPAIAAAQNSARPLASTTIKISLETTPILSDHVLKHRAVVPAALMLEWLSAAAQSAVPAWKLQTVENFQVWKGIVLDPSAHYEVECIPLKREEAAGDMRWIEMTLRGAASEGMGRAHAHARLGFKAELAAPQTVSHKIPEADAALQDLKVYEGTLFHGEKLYLLDSILSCDEKGLWASIRLQGEPSDWATQGLQENWIVDAPLLDAVFQAAIVWSTRELGLRSLPSRVGRISFAGQLPRDEVLFLELELMQKETHSLKLRASILGSDRQEYWRIEEFEVIMDASLATPFAQNHLDTGAKAEENTQG